MKGTIRVYEKKDGTRSYYCQVFAGIDPKTGRRRYLSDRATSEREAHRVVHRLVSELEQGYVPRNQATVHDLIKAWLEAAGPQGEATRRAYAGYIKNYIAEDVGRIKVGKLRVEDLDRWHSELGRRDLAPATVRKAHNIVRGALSQGVRWGWISTNVAVNATPPSVPKPVVKTPKAEDVGTMLRRIKDKDPEFAVFLRLSAVTGARPGEMCGLRWSDIDWETGEVAIERRVVRGEKDTLVKELTKTGKTRRIPLDSRTVAALREHRNLMEERADEAGTTLHPEAFVFSDTADGLGYWRPDSASRRFRSLADRVGAKGFTLYSIRHQAATTMIDAGIDAKTVSDRLGNSVATVLSTYTRARSEADRAAAEVMGTALD